MLNDVRDHVNAFCTMKNLSLEEMKAVAEAIQSSKRLVNLDLTVPLSEGRSLAKLKALVEGLKGSKVLQLELSKPGLGLEGVRVLSDALKDTQLEILRLDRNSLTLKGVEALVNGLAGSKVKELELFHCALGVAEVKVLAEAAKVHPLTYFDFRGNNLSHEAVGILAAVLRQSSLQTLRLEENRKIGDKGAKLLAEGLKGSKVKCLGLTATGIKDEGAKALAECLKDCRVEELCLGVNLIYDDGVRALAANLRHSNLSKLDVTAVRRPLQRETGVALLAGLRESGIQELEVVEEDFSPKVWKDMKAVLKANKARSFVLQVEAQKVENMLKCKFRTLAGTVAAVLDWELDCPYVGGLSQHVMKAMGASDFVPPFKGLAEDNLKFVLPGGALLDLYGGSLAQQLGLVPKPSAKKRARGGSASAKASAKRARAE